MKLQANFFKAVPQWLVADAHNLTDQGQIADTDMITVTALTTDTTAFYVVRHTDYSSMDSTTYKMRVPTSLGTLTLPALGGSLVLNGRDSKILSTDLTLGHANVLYSTDEVYTWQSYQGKTMMLFYAGPDEENELAFKTTDRIDTLEGRLSEVKYEHGIAYVRWTTSQQRVLFQFGNVEVYILGTKSPLHDS